MPTNRATLGAGSTEGHDDEAVPSAIGASREPVPLAPDVERSENPLETLKRFDDVSAALLQTLVRFSSRASGLRLENPAGS